MPRTRTTKQELQIEEISLIPMFPFTVKLVYKKGGDFNQMLEELTVSHPFLKLYGPPLHPNIQSTVITCDEVNQIVFVLLNEDFAIDTMIHESDHVTFCLFELIGSPVTSDTEEFHAYIQEFLCREIYKIAKFKFKLKMPFSMDYDMNAPTQDVVFEPEEPTEGDKE